MPNYFRNLKLAFAAIFLLAAASLAQGQTGQIGLLGVGGPPSAGGSVAYVNDCANGNFGSSGTVSSLVTVGGAQCKNSTTVSSGNILVAGEYSPSAATTLSTPTGTCVSSWTAVSNGTGASLNFYTWIGTETTTGSCTVVFGGTVTTSTNVDGHVVILSGAVTTVRNSAYGTPGFCSSSCALTSISANSGDMILGILFANPSTSTATSPYTLGFTANTGGDSVGLVYDAAASTGSIPSPAYTSDGAHNPAQASLAVEP